MNKTIFTDKVYELTKQIPKGKVVTYGQLAKMAGSPRAARAVGMIMKTNPNAPQTPCHRVVASNGKLTGYSGGNGVSTKKEIKSIYRRASGIIIDEFNLSYLSRKKSKIF